MMQRKVISLCLSAVLMLGGLPTPALAEAFGEVEAQDAEVMLLDSGYEDDAAAPADELGNDLNAADGQMDVDDEEPADDTSSAEATDAEEAQSDARQDAEPEASLVADGDNSPAGEVAGPAVPADDGTNADAAAPAEVAAEAPASDDAATSVGSEPEAADESRRYGYKDDPITVHSIHDGNEEQTLETLASLPSFYSSVDQGYITPVKDQHPFGTCWTFAAMATIEASALRSGLTLGYDRRSLDLSERHLAYFAYHSAADPLGYTAGDYNYNTDPVDHYLNAGGNNTMSLLTLTTWQGVAQESLASYQELRALRNRYYNASDFLAATSLSSGIAYSDIFHVSGGLFIPSKNRSDVKRAIQRYGAVAGSYYDSDDYFNRYTASYYNYNNTSTNHAIAIVGWDDDYSKYNFKNIPSNSGAWLVKNSWGTGYGDGGYFWLSYYDTSIGQNVLAYKVERATRHQNVYQHDGSAYPYYETIRSGSRVANIFRAKAGKKGERLEAVSFFLQDVNVNYSIQIYLDPTDPKKPTSGSPALAEPVRGKTSYEGFYKVDLNEKVPLIKGTKYAVVITFSKGNGDHISIGTDETYRDWGHVNSVKRKQGFLYEKGVGWSDLYSRFGTPANARIKAYTSNDNLTARTKIQNVTVAVPNKVYTGKRLTPTPKVTNGRVVLHKGTDYTVSYKSNLHAGTGKVIIKGKGRYSGTQTATFKITRKSIAKAKVTVAAKVAYKGRALKPTVSVKLGKTTLKKGKHYTVKYVNNVHVGTATVKVVGKGDYHGTKEATFRIVNKGGTTSAKKANTMKVSTKAKTVSASKVKSKAVTVAPIVVKNAKGKVTYKKVSGAGALKVNTKTGKVTVKKGTKSGVYKAKVKVRVAGNASYKAASKTVTVKVVVKKASSSSKRWEKEPNNYYDVATRLPLNTDVYGKTDFPDDDRFVFAAPSAGYYTVKITSDKYASEGSLRVWTYDANHSSYQQDFSIELSECTWVSKRIKLKKGTNYLWIWGSSCLNQHPYHIRVSR